MNAIKNKTTRVYEEKLIKCLDLNENRDFLIQKLQSEWKEIEKQAKREQVIARAKTGGMIMGKTILSLLIITGVLTVAAVAPNMFAAFGRLTKNRRTHRAFFEKEKFYKIKNYLLKQNYIRFIPQDDGVFTIEITDKGKRRALSEIFNNLKIQKPKKWDRFWRIVIFDIPEKHKWAREGFRDKLQSLGFYQLQKSVFICPYPCDREIKFLISIFNISSYVHFIKAPHLENDQELKKYFNLNN